jgi:hypothetical protein
MLFAPWLTLFPSRLGSDKETDASKVARELEGSEDPKTFKEWWDEFKGVAKRLSSSRVRMLLF